MVIFYFLWPRNLKLEKMLAVIVVTLYVNTPVNTELVGYTRGIYTSLIYLNILPMLDIL